MRLFLFLLVPLLLLGCARREPLIITKEVFVPQKLTLRLPEKPFFDGSLKSARERLEYYEKVEMICKEATK